LYWLAVLHQIHPPTEEVAGGPHPFRIGVRLGQHAAAEEHGDFFRIDLVVLGFPSMNGLHVEGVAENEGNVVLGTQIGQPVPGEHALDAHDQVLPAVQSNRVQEPVRLGR
jgi:hypothetical protein